ncbi:putative uncharacterized protein MYH16 [Cylas formicarius]|uniref:putative uncharacterized protein MYH16 n=1 Tax=Cylas formicarius TaxID=197179 RepID=UPI0029586D0D|nr:putative uncharacterized protein MYH16 [Cylas formicarius]
MAETQSENSQATERTPKEYEEIIKKKDRDIEDLKQKLELMEMEVTQAQKMKTQRSKEHEEVAALKEQSEGILTKAKGIIFENTKVIKNQELQIETLNQQVESLKDVVRITKDLLEIRNLEVKQLEDKIGLMSGKVSAEKERQDLLHRKLETMIRHNGELKREYETQLCLFQALRERYNERELANGVVNNLRQDVAEAKQENTVQNGEPAAEKNDAHPEANVNDQKPT